MKGKTMSNPAFRDNATFRDDVDEMLRNAELRSELEPYFDESISRVNVQHFSLRREND